MRTVLRCSSGKFLPHASLNVSHLSTFSTANLMSKTSKEMCISKLQNESSPRPTKLTNDAKKSAVLLPLVDLDGQLGLVFTKRSKTLRSHRGEVSFPGGKHDEADTNLVETACRETCEELGVARDNIEIWTEMAPYSTYDNKQARPCPLSRCWVPPQLFHLWPQSERQRGWWSVLPSNLPAVRWEAPRIYSVQRQVQSSSVHWATSCHLGDHRPHH